MALMKFSEALHDSNGYSRRHILLGNGFSIACRPHIFAYGKLFEQAEFLKISPTAKTAFSALGTQDFEKVIKALRDASKIVSAYGDPTGLAATLAADADGLKELLVQTIAASHPSWPGELTEEEYQACRAFLANFNTIYTLNYDLLLYWAQMHTAEGENPSSDDGFRTPEDDFYSSYVVWEPDQSMNRVECAMNPDPQQPHQFTATQFVRTEYDGFLPSVGRGNRVLLWGCWSLALVHLHVNVRIRIQPQNAEDKWE